MEKTCFVIIGFGKKTSYANGKVRVLNLDETYKLLIAPVFKKLGIPCYRAIDKNKTGSIDKLMLQEIMDADIALVDISTLNANVMWELGVRHALKPKHTIMICEKEQMSSIPFDINHFVVHQYTHTEEGIPYGEVKRFKKHLSQLVQEILSSPDEFTDSPVYTFLKDTLLTENSIKEGLKGNIIFTGTVMAINTTDEQAQEESIASLLDRAELAKDDKNYKKAISLFELALKQAKENMLFREMSTFIIGRIALCTYKSENPNKLASLKNAWKILQTMNPTESDDMEILGLSGAIHKRLYEITNQTNYLEESIKFYEKGFFLRKDYYNGINSAFMLYLLADLRRKNGVFYQDLIVKADFIRDSVIKICLERENEKNFLSSKESIWILLTLAEAYQYQNDPNKEQEYFLKAGEHPEAGSNAFAFDSYLSQKSKIETFWHNLQKLK